jgi:hypothetical protein
MLKDIVGPIPGAANKTWNSIATSCHFATVYWLLAEVLSRQPNLEDFVRIGDPTLIVKQMLAKGRRISRSRLGSLMLTPGTVVAFVQDGEPKHSCVAIESTKLGGYNQTGWFSTPGVDHGYSTHHTIEFKWRGGQMNADDVQGNQGQWCQLYAIDETSAENVVRQRTQS